MKERKKKKVLFLFRFHSGSAGLVEKKVELPPSPQAQEQPWLSLASPV